jgi:hypothetical protein
MLDQERIKVSSRCWRYSPVHERETRGRYGLKPSWLQRIRFCEGTLAHGQGHAYAQAQAQAVLDCGGTLIPRSIDHEYNFP